MLKRAVDQRLQDVRSIMEGVLNKHLPLPNVSYKLRGNSAGRAHMATRAIDFNLRLLSEHSDEFLTNSVPHEYAHIVVADTVGEVPYHHGADWQRLMKICGVAPNVTHTYSSRKVYTYLCSCNIHRATESQHRAIVKGASFTCNLCDEVVILQTPEA